MKKLIALVLALVCVFGMIGCGKHAEPIVLPAVDEIDSINITTFDNSEITYSDKEWIEQFIDILTNTETTTKESVQDIWSQNPSANRTEYSTLQQLSSACFRQPF